MTQSRDPVIVLGAGSAGLTAAYELHRLGIPVEVVDACPEVGGLALTFEYRGFRLDYGPHAFHAKGDEADEVFIRFCDGQYRQLAMRAALLLEGKYFDYPLRFGRAIKRLKPSTAARIVTDYGRAWIARKTRNVPERTFEEWGIKRYGRTMYDLAFGFYSSKVWGIPAAQLSRKLAQQKLPDLSLRELIREAVGGKGAKQKILYSKYLYPQGGIGVVFERMRAHLEAGGVRVHLSHRLAEIEVRENRATAVVIQGRDGRRQLPASAVISTIPIPDAVSALRPEPPRALRDHANALVYRNLILVMLVVDLPNVTNEMMVYLLDRQFSSNRIGEQKNMDPSMIPADRTVLTFELCVDDQSPLWSADDETVAEIARRDLRLVGTVRDDQISQSFVRRLPHAYPVYDLDFDAHLGPALNGLLAIENVVPLGRQGLFIHNDVHDSMAMGLAGARHVASGAPAAEWETQVRSLLEWRLR